MHMALFGVLARAGAFTGSTQCILALLNIVTPIWDLSASHERVRRIRLAGRESRMRPPALPTNVFSPCAHLTTAANLRPADSRAFDTPGTSGTWGNWFRTQGKEFDGR